MIAVQAFSVLIVAVLLHEGVHYVLLRGAGAEPHFTVRAWGLKGVGWRFDARGLPKATLAYQWIAGPCAEMLVWLWGILLFPDLANLFKFILVFSLAGNMLLPGSDGWRAFKSMRAAWFTGPPLFSDDEHPDPDRIRQLELDVLDDPPDEGADGRICQGRPEHGPAVHRRIQSATQMELWLCRKCCQEFDGYRTAQFWIGKISDSVWALYRDVWHEMRETRQEVGVYRSFEAASAEKTAREMAYNLLPPEVIPHLYFSNGS